MSEKDKKDRKPSKPEPRKAGSLPPSNNMPEPEPETDPGPGLGPSQSKKGIMSERKKSQRKSKTSKPDTKVEFLPQQLPFSDQLETVLEPDPASLLELGMTQSKQQSKRTSRTKSKPSNPENNFTFASDISQPAPFSTRRTTTDPDGDFEQNQNQSVITFSLSVDEFNNDSEKVPSKAYKNVSTFKKFGLLLWKNLQILKHHKLQTVFEILLPVLFVLTVLIVRVIIGTPQVGDGKIWPPYSPAEINNTLFSHKLHDFLYFSPNTPKFTEIMKLVQDNYFAFGASIAVKSKGFSTEKDLAKKFSLSKGDVLGGIVFEDTGNQNVIRYKIRLSTVQRYVNPLTLLIFEVPQWHTRSVYPDPQLRGARQPYAETGGTPGYFHQGFTYLQFAIDASIIKYWSDLTRPTTSTPMPLRDNVVDGFRVNIGRFIHSTFSDDRYLELFIIIFQIVIVLSFIYPVNNIVKYVVVEKEKRLVESMKRMGIGPGLHWSAWFVNHIFFLLITDGLMVVVLAVLQFSISSDSTSGVIVNSDPSVIFVFLLSYICSVITFGFFLSTLFSNANTAVMASWIIFISTYLPNIFLASQYKNMTLVHKLPAMLFLNTALGYGFKIILILDGFGPYGEGQHWSNIRSSAGSYDDLSLFYVILMLFVDAVVYMLLAIYIEAVWPGQYGIPRPWYFPIQKSYWCPKRNAKVPTPTTKQGSTEQGSKGHGDDSSITSDVPKIDYDANPNFEPPPDNLKAGIKIRGLKKVFGSHTAVNNLNIDMFENQITVLLGHNGAGKTTTMSMLTGLFPPTSGTALVNDFDIRTHMSHIQGNIGLCPQHDVLFDELTCEQHLKFYCWAKGCPDVNEQVELMLAALNLLPKKTTASKALSGGMKRKLSVGMALIGGSQVVIFDEPTAGMDPAARRRVWDILASEKKNRTIILSTHFMDEADLLGDRIAVMADGQLQTVGSSLFLKKLYGDGYQLVIVKQQGCDVSKITELLEEHLRDDVEVSSNIGAELSYSLAQDKSPLFPDLFDALEERRKELMIDSYGASITTMEEVFMRVGIEAELKKLTRKKTSSVTVTPSTQNKRFSFSFIPECVLMNESDISEPNDLNVVSIHEEPKTPNIFKTTYKSKTGLTLYCQQFYAQLVKKWLYISRNWAIIIIQVFVPVALILIVYIGVGSSAAVEEENIELSLTHFKGTITPMLCHNKPGTNPCDRYKKYADKFTTVKEIKSLRTTTTLPNTPMDDFILAQSQKSLTDVDSKIIIGLESDENGDNYVALFNNQPYHAQPIALNFLMNALLREITGDEKKEIRIWNHPFPVTEYEKATFKANTQFLIFVLGLMVMFGFSFLVSSFVIFLIREREGKCKHLQRVSGLNIGIFWIANFTFDFFTYLLTTGFVMTVVVAFELEPYSKKETYIGVFALLITFGWAVIPIVYITSFWFSLPATGFTKLAIMNIFLGTGMYLIMAIIHIPFFEAKKLADALESLFLFLPIFSMGYGIYELGFQQNLHSECPPLFEVDDRDTYCAINGPDARFPLPCCTYYAPYFGWAPYGIQRNLLYLTVTGFLAFGFLAIVEAKLLNRFCKIPKCILKKTKTVADEVLEEDTDVAEERIYIQTTNQGDLLKSETLVLKNLTKHFGTFTAVHDLNLGVQKGECFGLLGVNGAGKTTTFRMLTGDLVPSSGDAFVVGHSIRKDMKSIQKLVGFCPQFDALINELTGRETIRLFARLRGLHERKMNDLADKLGDILKFKQFLDKPVGPYSGGNKRKLSTAIALVGNPALVFLDEPSSGMDPMARRHLWDCITQVRDSGTSIVLTSHSMEECEALCTRLVIMVNGHFRCLGSIQHLKSKFSEGFTVTAQVQTKTAFNKSSLEEIAYRRTHSNKNLFEWEIEIKPLQRYIEDAFPDSILKDVHPGYVHYHITNTSLTWGYLFRKMERAKTLFRLEAYSVGQTSMDQIFLIFGKGQVADE